MNEQTPPQGLGQQHNPSERGISSIVMYSLLFLGLTAEYFALMNFLSGMEIIESVMDMLIIRISVILMLTHQFMIFRNFHIIDHFTDSDYVTYGVGNWIAKSTTEDIMRIALFFLFACLTGEVVYLFIVGTKSMPFLKHMTTVKDGTYDLTWITPFYVRSALTLSILMLAWDSIGYCYDKKVVPKFSFRKYQPNDKIVYYPLSSPYYTFIFCDVISLLFWIFISVILFVDWRDATKGFWLFLILYSIFIGLRIWGEIQVNFPRISENTKNYWKNARW